MTNLLTRLFIKNHTDVTNPDVRAAYGTLSGIVGIIVNVLLFTAKFIIGTLSGSIAITADAVNNLSDAGASAISLVTFRISAKPADREHPFGHARIEYVASMIVSLTIVLIGYELFTSSLDKILHPTETEFRIAAVVVLALSICGKLWLGLFNRAQGRRIDSPVLRASGTDSMTDAISTTGVLISLLISKFTGFDTDGYMGIIVAVIILFKYRKLGIAQKPGGCTLRAFDILCTTHKRTDNTVRSSEHSNKLILLPYNLLLYYQSVCFEFHLDARCGKGLFIKILA